MRVHSLHRASEPHFRDKKSVSKRKHRITGAVPGITLPFNLSMALCAASALLKSTKQYPAGFLEIKQ